MDAGVVMYKYTAPQFQHMVTFLAMGVPVIASCQNQFSVFGEA
jgi:hypothetical protein